MSKWFVKQRHRKDAKARMFLFPYAGGGPSAFRGWQDYFEQSIDVFVIHAPGRESRFTEEPINSLTKITEILQQEIRPYLDIPHVFVGHSNGSMIALELAREMARNGNKKLLHIVASAKPAPHLPSKTPPIYNLPYEEFVADLKENSSIPNVILNDRDMLDVFIPTLRADYALGIGYNFSDPTSLDCNASLFWGSEDKNVSKEDMLPWDRYFNGKITIKEFAGDHFFITSRMKDYIEEIKAILKEYTPVINSYHAKY